MARLTALWIYAKPSATFFLVHHPRKTWSAPGTESHSQHGDYISSVSCSRPPINRISCNDPLQDRRQFTTKLPSIQKPQCQTQNASHRHSDSLNLRSSHTLGMNRRNTARGRQLRKISSRWPKIPGQSHSLHHRGYAQLQAQGCLAHYWENGDWYRDQMKRVFICCRWGCSRTLLRVGAHLSLHL